ncbi:hypothetical protein VTN00DRAFT_2072 [Thermoascus crustaceus]|uniref:uncharacterized protein n=1 Tax=Thermoascus crustaceus TaxID=5088 RepID=UPI00374449A7
MGLSGVHTGITCSRHACPSASGCIPPQQLLCEVGKLVAAGAEGGRSQKPHREKLVGLSKELALRARSLASLPQRTRRAPFLPVTGCPELSLAPSTISFLPTSTHSAGPASSPFTIPLPPVSLLLDLDFTVVAFSGTRPTRTKRPQGEVHYVLSTTSLSSHARYLIPS